MKKLDILYEDKKILVVNKPSKLLTISDGKSENTLYHAAREYVKKQHKNNKIFIVHRLDKDTSGIVLFVKEEKLKKELQDSWNAIAQREYIAIVEGKLEQNQGRICEYLKEDVTHRVFVSSKKTKDYAQTDYEVIKRNKNNTVVKVSIKTGKKNQIRVAFQSIGHPIIGDKKYGSKKDSISRLALHASSLKLKIKGEEKEFVCSLPKEMQKYL